MDDERRRSFRCRVQLYDDAAILKGKRGDVIVRVVESSAGGFGVVADSKTQVKSGEVLTLMTNNESWSVRVVHVTRQDRVVRLGLQRLAETGKPRAGRFSRGGGRMRSYTSIRRWLQGAGVAAIIGLAWMIYYPEHSPWKALSRPAQRALPKVITSWSDNDAVPAAATWNAEFPELKALNSSELVERLDLSLKQQEQMTEVIESTVRGLNRVYTDRDTTLPGDWSDRAMLIIHASFLEMSDLMTDEQRRRWREWLLEQNGPRKS